MNVDQQLQFGMTCREVRASSGGAFAASAAPIASPDPTAMARLWRCLAMNQRPGRNMISET